LHIIIFFLSIRFVLYPTIARVHRHLVRRPFAIHITVPIFIVHLIGILGPIFDVRPNVNLIDGRPFDDWWEAFDNRWDAFDDWRDVFDDWRDAFNDQREAFNDRWEAFDDQQEAFSDQQEAFGDQQEVFGDQQEAFHD
jgi:hypothetical protein